MSIFPSAYTNTAPTERSAVTITSEISVDNFSGFQMLCPCNDVNIEKNIIQKTNPPNIIIFCFTSELIFFPAL